MGYYSEAALTIENTAFMWFMEKATAENIDAYNLIQNASVFQTDALTTIYFDWIKWYEGYKDIKFIEDFIRDIPHVFKRIGESNDDIEYRCSNVPDFNMYDCVGFIRTLDLENAGNMIFQYEQEAA
jgi:hypothetical protein